MRLKYWIGVLIIACCFFTLAFKQQDSFGNKLKVIDEAINGGKIKSQSIKRHDSATIIFKNVSSDTMLYIHAIIKNQFMFDDTIIPNGEYRHKIRSDSVIPGDPYAYRFHVVFTGGEEASITPMDYCDEVSKMDITTGTYIYYIGKYVKEDDDRLQIKLKKLK
jgi:hypothetical protein